MSFPSTRDRLTRRTIAGISLSAFLMSLLMGCSDGASDRADHPSPNVTQLDGTSLPPWSPPADVADRVADAGLDLGPMGMAEHYHPVLHILVKGSRVPVPAGIGIDPATGAMSGLHTHSSDGVLHVEAGTAGEVFTLGQLFTEWGVTLSSTQIGGVHAKPGDDVSVTISGEPVAGNPVDLRLAPDQQILLRLP